MRNLRSREFICAFLKTDDIEYAQFNNEFQQNLSILDVMMFNSVSEIREMLKKYTLITSEI